MEGGFMLQVTIELRYSYVLYILTTKGNYFY